MNTQSQTKRGAILIICALLFVAILLAYKSTYLNQRNTESKLKDTFMSVSNMPSATLQASQLEMSNNKQSYVAKWTFPESTDIVRDMNINNLKSLGWTVTDPEQQDDGNLQWYTATKENMVINVNIRRTESNSTDLQMEIYSTDVRR